MEESKSIEKECRTAQMVRDFVARACNEEVAAICGRVLEAAEEGDVCMKIEPEEAAPLEASGIVSVVSAGNLQADRLFVLDGHRLYTRRNWRYEQAVKKQIKAMAAQQDAGDVRIPDEAAYRSLNPEQREAVLRMCNRHFTILTGGPGTGKTHTIARAVKLMQEHGVKKIGLAAPTAKAADRMRESMDKAASELQFSEKLEPKTLHTFLEANYDFVTFKHHQGNRLDLEWLIVDEASMVDLPMMAKLLDAFPESCRLTLVGDPHQLASVEPGYVFGDLCDMPSLQACKCELKQSVRFDEKGEIGQLAKAINEGRAEEALRCLKDSGPEGRLHYIRLDAGDDAGRHQVWEVFRKQVQTLFRRFYGQTSAAGILLPPDDAPLDDCRILCAVRNGVYGCKAINARVRKTIEQETNDYPVPMMVTKNNRSIGVDNGDVGVVMHGKEQDEEKLWLRNGQELRDVPKSLLPELETAFAMTIHKSQGSEYKNVVIVLPPPKDADGHETQAASLLTRELLYTAVTRTKEKVYLFATDEAVRLCCERRTVRNTGLRD